MIKKEFFDKLNGKDIFKFTLKDEIEVEIVSLGGTILSIKTPDKIGQMIDVVLNVTDVKDIYDSYMGAIIGRFGNRIENGRFTLDGKTYQLAQNFRTAHLHGGKCGFDKKIFDYKVEDDSLILSYLSPDMEENYPSDLELKVKYTVKKSALIIEYFATTDGKTIFNPTNHAYFNLNGENDGNILDNYLMINADRYLPTNESWVPTGEERSVKNTPFDFRFFKQIGKDINSKDEQMLSAGGYDHNFCLTEEHAASAYSIKTGIKMDVYTDMPGVQFYAGNLLNGEKGKSVYNKWSGFCLETQLFPDCINKPQWKSPVLSKGDNFYSKTEYVFSLNK